MMLPLYRRPHFPETPVMWLTSSLRSTKRFPKFAPMPAQNSAHGRWAFLPWLEVLDDRTLLSTLTVMNNLDKGPGSLRDAIGHARDGDTVVFDPGLNGQT